MHISYKQLSVQFDRYGYVTYRIDGQELNLAFAWPKIDIGRFKFDALVWDCHTYIICMEIRQIGGHKTDCQSATSVLIKFYMQPQSHS